MTSNTSPAPFVTYVSAAYAAGYEAYRVFNKTYGLGGSGWFGRINVSNEYLTIDLGTIKNIAAIEIYTMSRPITNVNDYGIAHTAYFSISTNGSDWMQIASKSMSIEDCKKMIKIVLSDNINTRYFKYHTSGLNQNLSGTLHVGLGEMQLYTRQ